MRVSVCNECGLTMQGGVYTCQGCNQRNLTCHEIHMSDTWELNQRVYELGHHGRQSHAHPNLTAVLVLALGFIALVVTQIQSHPGGAFAKQAMSWIGCGTTIASRPTGRPTGRSM